jgi:hypothetical protein
LPGRDSADERGPDLGHYASLYDKLESALKNQDIVAGLPRTYYNQGLGMLQLILAKDVHVTFPGSGTPYLPFQNPNVFFLTADPQDWGYSWNPSYNNNIQNDMREFVYSHVKAGRMEVLINGIQNLSEEVEESAQALQRRLDQTLNVSDDKGRTPVLAQYNVSSKLYYSSNLDAFAWNFATDLDDCFAQKIATDTPNAVTKNNDSIRLIATLQALTQTLWSRDYQLLFYLEHKDPTLPQELWKISYEGAGVSVVNLAEVVSWDKPLENIDYPWIKYVPKYHKSLEEDFPDPDTRDSKIKTASDVFSSKLKDEFIRLYAKLSSIPVTLHAHSQGAIIASVVHSRLGSVPATRKNLQGLVQGMVSVADKIDLVTYGGAANMYNWGPAQRFRSYIHHVNVKDAVTMLGMGNPFASLLKPALARSASVGDFETMVESQSPDEQILVIPPDLLGQAWKTFHKVIYHGSSANSLNYDEHNFTNGYICNANPDPSTLTPLRVLNKFEGKLRCNDQQLIP